mmetsp:Transcript_30019/g.82372  ORF Transcript_30019/g.82372 Transcript_30019/m.82372 type:complete len:210 (+) Transcript_30019:334-963(+)
MCSLWRSCSANSAPSLLRSISNREFAISASRRLPASTSKSLRASSASRVDACIRASISQSLVAIDLRSASKRSRNQVHCDSTSGRECGSSTSRFSYCWLLPASQPKLSQGASGDDKETRQRPSPSLASLSLSQQSTCAAVSTSMASYSKLMGHTDGSTLVRPGKLPGLSSSLSTASSSSFCTARKKSRAAWTSPDVPSAARWAARPPTD